MNWLGMATLFAALALVATACAASPDDNRRRAHERLHLRRLQRHHQRRRLNRLPFPQDRLPSPTHDPTSSPRRSCRSTKSSPGAHRPMGYRPLDAPVFVDAALLSDQLEPAESVVALEINGDARAYPVRVMIWHEIVNDTVGDVPVSVTYCPLCNSAVSYRREVNGVETTFGTSGSLYASALVMYDRLTESLWTHFDGPRCGRRAGGYTTRSHLLRR